MQRQYIALTLLNSGEPTSPDTECSDQLLCCVDPQNDSVGYIPTAFPFIDSYTVIYSVCKIHGWHLIVAY